jgi:Zn-dependent protease with chaperone function
LQGRAFPWTAVLLTSAVYFLFFVIAFKCFQSLLDLAVWLYGDLTVRGLISHFQQPFIRWDLAPAVVAGVFVLYCLFRSVREFMSASEAGEESLVQDLGGVDFPSSHQEMDRIKGDYIREKNQELADLVGLKTPKLYFQPDEPGINTFVTEIKGQPVIVITWGTVAYLTLAELEILILAQLIRLKTGRPKRETKVALLFWGFFSLRLFGLYLWRNPSITYCPRFLSGPVLLLGTLGTSLAHPVQVILGRFDEQAADRKVASHLVDRNIMAELLKKTGSVNRKNGRLRTPSAMD